MISRPPSINSLIRSSLFVVTLCVSNGCGGWWARPGARDASAPAPNSNPALVLSSKEETRSTVRFFEERVKRDPDDFIAHNQLADYYLQLEHETGDTRYLELALDAARNSLKALPEEQNTGGLAALVMAEAAQHMFAEAYKHALRLVELEPGKLSSYVMLFDLLLELGKYDEAERVLAKMDTLPRPDAAVETRHARLAQIKGDPDTAARRFKAALALSLALSVTDAETICWYHWQLGEVAFSVGQYETAERHYRDALKVLPDDLHARASLARVRAAVGDLEGAVKEYTAVNQQLPEPPYLAALGDLYKLAGRETEATAQYARVEAVARANPLESSLHERLLANYFADHDLKANEAYDIAVRDYAKRQDIYGADTLAWTALKAGKIREAQAAIEDAMRTGIRDAEILYHAGMIARAAGDAGRARGYLESALKLNPQFDPLQVSIAKKALAE
ncbi:MAG TPA: tetratricopeptide repeat protein [Pyrinomonadaceae bacterium]